MGSTGDDDMTRPAAIAEGAVVKLEADGGAVESDWRSAPPVTGPPSPELPARRSASAEAAALKAAERE